MKMPKVETEFFPLAGGLDLVTHRLKLAPGRARLQMNYKGKLGGGYRRIGGYQPYDGRARPEQQTYTLLYSTNGYTSLVAGDSITGGTSGATAKVIEVSSASPWHIAVTRVVGTFTDGENILEGADVRGVYNDGANDGALTGLDENRIFALVEAEYRTSIAAVPGSGDVLGVFEYKGSLYAIRNNAGGTAAVLHKEHASTGWTAIALNEEVAFSNANTSVGEGDTLTQGGVTATILRVVVATGTLASGVNTGYLVISARAGGNFAAGAATSTGGGALTLSGAQAAITLTAGGDYSFVEHNFTGSADTSRIYGADGVNFGLEFDGTVLVRVRTGMTTDTPSKVFAHKNQLFFSFRGSVQHSAPGQPYVWSVVLGAAEIGLGATVTGFLGLPGSESGGALMIFCSDRIRMLYGSGTSDWNLVNFAEKIGAAGSSLQMAGTRAMFMDALGITSAAAAQEFGGFSAGSISNPIQPLIKGKRDHVVASFVSRSESQYAILFDDKTGVVVTFGTKGIECMSPITLEHQAACAWETTRNGGEVFIGATDGYVYQLEAGRSFAGTAISAYTLCAFNHSKSPLTRKQYRRSYLECVGDSAFSLQVTSSIDYENTEIYQNDAVAVSVMSSGANWDEDDWDEVFYDGAETASPVIPLRGWGKNISIGFYSESANELPHELQGVLTNFTMRRLERDYA